MIASSKFKLLIFTLLSLFAVNSSFANDHAGEATKHEEEKEFNVGEMIMHHIKDAHEWHLFGPEHGGTSIYLPVIQLDNGLKTFSSNCHSGWICSKRGARKETASFRSYRDGSSKNSGYMF